MPNPSALIDALLKTLQHPRTMNSGDQALLARLQERLMDRFRNVFPLEANQINKAVSEFASSSDTQRAALLDALKEAQINGDADIGPLLDQLDAILQAAPRATQTVINHRKVKNQINDVEKIDNLSMH